MAIDLVTLPEYKLYAGITSTNQDVNIKNIIPKASQLVKNYCGRTFNDYINDAKVEYFNGGDLLLLEEYPVISVSSVEYSTDYGKTYSNLIEFVDYVLDKGLEGIKPLNSTNSFPEHTNGYRVTYTGGYENIPEDLKVAVLDLVTYYLKSDFSIKSQRDAGSNSIQIEYITKNSLPAHISRVLDLYLANVN